MAKIKFGAVIVDSRGSVGGTTLRMTRYGPVAYNKSTPTRKETTRNSEAKAQFAHFSIRWWSDLTPSQRSGWRALAAANPYVNPWGDEYALTGLAYYTKINCRLTLAGLAPMDDPPLDQAVTALTTLTISVTAPNSIVLTFTPTPTPTNHRLAVWATPPQNPGVTNVSGRLRYVILAPPSQASTYDVGAAYASKFGPTHVGRLYAVSAAYLKVTNGATGVPLIAQAVAT